MAYDLINEFDRFSADYIKGRSQFENSEQIKALVNNLSPLAGKKILELGCGSGIPVLKTFHDHNASVFGVDFSEPMVQAAKKNLPNGKIIKADIREVDYQNNYFDAILSFYVLFCVPLSDQFELFKKIYRWLKPGGIAYFTLFNKESTGMEEFSGLMEFMGYQLFYAHMTPEKYQAQLAEIGFTNIEWENRYIRDNDHCLWFYVEKERGQVFP